MDVLGRKIREEFQVERMIFFSDAVFAIAITLLVIDLHVPSITENLSDAALAGSLFHLLPTFLAFLISFYMIGLYWTVHHRMCARLITYTLKLLWLNLLYILSIVLIPFTTSLYAEYSDPQYLLPFGIYVFNICFLGAANFFLWHYISNPKHHLNVVPISREIRNYGMFRLFVPPTVFLISFLLTFFYPVISRMLPILIFPVYTISNRLFWKDYLEKAAPHSQDFKDG
jgi:uncharacterized membrane protein